jgi:hypothetical protein
MGDGEHGTRWILGFDGGCGTCRYLAQQLVELSGGRLTAQSLRSAEVQGWREQALGPDAPWAPTLFAVEGEYVRAWVGKGLIARLGQLVGPHKLWQIATIVGGLMEESSGPASPGRRLVIRRGLVGTAAGIALISGVGTSRSVALAQNVASRAPRYELEKLSAADFRNMEGRAERNRHFQIIREYFARQRDWRPQGREGIRLYENGLRARDGFALTYKAPGEREWAHVMLIDLDRGNEKSEGYLWRGRQGKFTDRFFVQNGNLRRDNGGRVMGAGAVAAAVPPLSVGASTTSFLGSGVPYSIAAVPSGQIGGCEVDLGVCKFGVDLACGAVTTAVALINPWGGGSVAAGCSAFGDDIKEPCVDFASGGECQLD